MKYDQEKMASKSRFSDPNNNSKLPGAEFSYTEKLGTSGTMCDYLFGRK